MTTYVALPRQSRVGMISTPEFVIPANLTGQFEIELDIDSTDLVDSSKSISVDIEVQNADLTWRDLWGFVWVGNNNLGPGGSSPKNPRMGTMNGTHLAGKRVRGTITIPSVVRVGVNINYSV